MDISNVRHRRSHSGRSLRLSRDNRRRFTLGHTRPWMVDYGPGVNRSGQENSRITQPWDELSHLDIIHLFSNSIEICQPPPRTSIGVQDTQPHNMPIPVLLNINRHEPVMDNENDHVNVDARAHNNSGGTTNMMIPNVPISQPIVKDNILTNTPVERPHDTDFSIDTIDRHSVHRIDADRRKDEKRRISKNLRLIRHDNGLANTNEGQMLPNLGTVTVNRKNITVNVPIATNSSCPKASDNERKVQNPAGCVNQSVAHATSSNLFHAKVQTRIDINDQSSEESTTSE